MGNKYIGTFDIELHGEKYTLRPSFDAMIEFEDQTGMSAQKAFEQIQQSNITFKVVAAAIWAGIKGQAYASNNPGAEVSFRVIGEQVKQCGLLKATPHAIKFITYGMLPDADIRKFEDAQEEPEKKPES